jgi:hypothetical protein
VDVFEEKKWKSGLSRANAMAESLEVTTLLFVYNYVCVYVCCMIELVHYTSASCTDNARLCVRCDSKH